MKNHKITIDLPDQPSLCKQFILSDDWIKGIATDQEQATGLEKKELEKMLEGDLVEGTNYAVKTASQKL